MIRKIITEELGIQKSVVKLTEFLFSEIKNTNIVNGDKVIELPESLKKEIPIDYILLTLNIDDKNSGHFLYKETKMVNNFYRIHLELKINIGDEIGLKSVISHELNHVYVYLKKYIGKQKTLKYNQVFHMLKHEFNEYEPLKEFIYLLYLNLPEEIQARVQEVGIVLDNIETDDYNETIKELYRYQSINDATNMCRFNIKKIMKLDHNILNNFINIFNLNKNYQGLDDKIITDVNKFFRYWEKFINEGGVKLNKKILKLVAKKHNKNEEFYYNGVYTQLLNEIFVGLRYL